jgi:hypothetical protein
MTELLNNKKTLRVWPRSIRTWSQRGSHQSTSARGVDVDSIGQTKLINPFFYNLHAEIRANTGETLLYRSISRNPLGKRLAFSMEPSVEEDKQSGISDGIYRSGIFGDPVATKSSLRRLPSYLFLRLKNTFFLN